MKRIIALVLSLACVLSLIGAAAYADTAPGAAPVNSTKEIIESAGITIPEDFNGNYNNGVAVTLYFYNTYSILRSSPEDVATNNLRNIYYYFETDRQITKQLTADGKTVEVHEQSKRITVPQTAISFGSYKGFSLVLWNGCYGWIKDTGIYNGPVDKGREYVIDRVVDSYPDDGSFSGGTASMPNPFYPAPGTDVRAAAIAAGIKIPDDFAVGGGTTVTLYFYNTYSIMRTSPEDGASNNIRNIYYFTETGRETVQQVTADGKNIETHEISYRVTNPQYAVSYGSYKGFSLVYWNGYYGWIKDTGIYNGTVENGRSYTIDTITKTEPVPSGYVIEDKGNSSDSNPSDFDIRTAAAACGTEVPDDFVVIFETGAPVYLFYPNSFSYFRSAPDSEKDHVISIIYLNTDTNEKNHLRADCKQVMYYGSYDGYMLIKWNGVYGWVKDTGLSVWGDISGTYYNTEPETYKK